jgi:hypothetical protein
MNDQKILVDEAALRGNLMTFLKSPAAGKVVEELDTPFWLCAVGATILLTAGVLMLPTIVWTKSGLKAIWSVLRLEPFSALADNPSRKPEQLRPLVAHGVIIGPDQKHALVLGSFAPHRRTPDDLAHMASWLGNLYAEGPSRPEETAVCELLRDDTYRPWRRRRVPEPFAASDEELYLFDVEVDPREGRATPYDSVMFAFVATAGEKGEIVQIPWTVADSAVRCRA